MENLCLVGDHSPTWLVRLLYLSACVLSSLVVEAWESIVPVVMSDSLFVRLLEKYQKKLG